MPKKTKLPHICRDNEVYCVTCNEFRKLEDDWKVRKCEWGKIKEDGTRATQPNGEPNIRWCKVGKCFVCERKVNFIISAVTAAELISKYPGIEIK